MTSPELLQLALMLLGSLVDRCVDWVTTAAMRRAHRAARAPMTAASSTATWHVALPDWRATPPGRYLDPVLTPQPSCPLNRVQLMARGLDQ